MKQYEACCRMRKELDEFFKRQELGLALGQRVEAVDNDVDNAGGRKVAAARGGVVPPASGGRKSPRGRVGDKSSLALGVRSDREKLAARSKLTTKNRSAKSPPSKERSKDSPRSKERSKSPSAGVRQDSSPGDKDKDNQRNPFLGRHSRRLSANMRRYPIAFLNKFHELDYHASKQLLEQRRSAREKEQIDAALAAHARATRTAQGQKTKQSVENVANFDLKFIADCLWQVWTDLSDKKVVLDKHLFATAFRDGPADRQRGAAVASYFDLRGREGEREGLGGGSGGGAGGAAAVRGGGWLLHALDMAEVRYAGAFYLLLSRASQSDGVVLKFLKCVGRQCLVCSMVVCPLGSFCVGLLYYITWS